MKINSLKFLREGSTISDALKSTNIKPFGVCFFVNDIGKLLSIFTDGDLRRLLIEKKDLDYTINKYDFKDFKSVIHGTSVKKMIDICNNKI